MAETVDLAIDRTAPVERLELADGGWVDLVRGFVRDPDGAFGRLHADTPWQQTEVLRYDRYVPERRLSAGRRPESDVLLRHTDLHLQSRYRVRFEGVAAILYRDGSDFQGLHSDRELRWLDDTLIAIVVLGARRPFVLRPRGSWREASSSPAAGAAAGDVVLTPGEGDLLVMGGACQRTWLHGVPAAPTAQARISLTWRWTSRRGRPDTAPSYYDGRQFADRARQAPTRRGRAPDA